MTPFIYYIVLHCIEKLNGERTISSIYHLLRGKKSSQTIQDARLFKLHHFFRTNPQLTRSSLMKIVDELTRRERIELIGEQTFILTNKDCDHSLKQFPFLSYLNGWKFQNSDQFWKRLSLTVQVSSNLKDGNRKYIPIQRDPDTQRWLKQFLRKHPFSRFELGEKLYRELSMILKENEYIDPSVLVLRLTGSNQYGLTAKQASNFLKMDYSYYNYQFLSLLHFMMEYTMGDSKSFPILSGMIQDLVKKGILTKSTEKTYEWLQRGFTLKEISEKRNLKLSTIQDHIVEIALNIDDFNIDPYVSKQLEESIIHAVIKTKSKQLKTIRALVEEADYFQIRLVLAKNGDIEWNSN